MKLSVKKTAPYFLIAGGCGVAFFVALMAFLEWRGYATGPEAARQLIAAKALAHGRYFTWLKTEYGSFFREIVHADFSTPPLMPLFLTLLRKLGIESWHAIHWLAAVFASLCIPAWSWAFRPHLKNIRRLPITLAPIAILFLGMVLLVPDVTQGNSVPASAFFLLLTYGLMIRNRFTLAGLLSALALLSDFHAFWVILALVLGHLILSRKAKHLAITSLTFIVGSSPWWIRSLLNKHPPWFHSSNAAWFHADPMTFSTSPPDMMRYSLVEYFTRTHWFEFIKNYTTPFLSEALIPGLLFFLSILYGTSRPQERFVLLVSWLSIVLGIYAAAAFGHGFDPNMLRLQNLFLLASFTVLLWDSNFWIRAFSWVYVITFISLQLTGFYQTPFTSGVIEPFAPVQAIALKAANPENKPVLTSKDSAYSLAYYDEAMPTLVVPDNWKSPGVLDLLIQQYGIGWMTLEPSPGLLTKFVLERTSMNGAALWQIKPLPAASAETGKP